MISSVSTNAGATPVTARGLDWLGLIAFCLMATLLSGQTITLDNFNNGTASGSALSGTSWVGNVTQNATTVTVGSGATNVNGWAGFGLNLNASSMNYLRIVGQRDSGHESPNVAVQFNDVNLTLDAGLFTVGSDAFREGVLTQVQIPIASWGAGFDSSSITDWSLGGGATGTDAFRMTFDNLELSSQLLPLAGGIIITAGDQIYTTAQTITADTTLGNTGGANNTGQAITFQSTVDGDHALTLETSGDLTFSGQVGGVTALESLTTDAGGKTVISGGGITTTGDQNYQDTVELGADTTFSMLETGLMQFAALIEGGGHSLTFNAVGNVQLPGAKNVSSLTKSGSGSLTLSGESTYTGLTDITAGSLVLGLNQPLSSSSTIRLSGGALDLNNHTLSVSGLTVSSASILDFGGSSGQLTLTSAAGSLWGGTLTINNYSPGQTTLRFGSDANGISAGNLALLRFSGFGDVAGRIDASGFVSPVPEPSATGLILGAVVLFCAGRRPRRRSVSRDCSPSGSDPV